MPGKKILFVSGSLGLGHVTRDLAIVNALRGLNAQWDVSWLTGNPQDLFLKEQGEIVCPESAAYGNENRIAENVADGFKLNMIKYVFSARKSWSRNIAIFKKLMETGGFDLIIGDETYDLNLALKNHPEMKKAPYVIIYDFIGVGAATNNLFEKLGAWIWNRVWVKGYKKDAPFFDLGLFVGEEEDIPDEKLGWGLPNRRVLARERSFAFLGYILPFNPGDYVDKKATRHKLGYGEEKLVICSIGGTKLGQELLELCGRAFPLIKEKIPNLRFVLNCGPRLETSRVNVPKGVEVLGYIPKLYEHFAAADLAIVQGGGTSTLELTALRRPFLYFPVEGHYEQEVFVARRLARHQAGIRMSYSHSTPQSLADEVVSQIISVPSWPPVPVNGAQKAAELIQRLLLK